MLIVKKAMHGLCKPFATALQCPCKDVAKAIHGSLGRDFSLVIPARLWPFNHSPLEGESQKPSFGAKADTVGVF